MRLASSEYGLLKNRKKEATCLQNIAFAKYESLKEVDSSLLYSNASLKIWEQQQDTLSLANLMKFIGVLYAEKSDFSLAEQFVNKASLLFQSKGFLMGKAVCDFDMANVFYLKADYSEALRFLNKAKSFWENKANNHRLFGINMLAIKIHMRQTNALGVGELILENDKILLETEIFEREQEKYFDLIRNFYLSQDKKKLADKYLLKSRMLRDKA